MMRQLTIPEINKLASRKNIKKIAVENFLMSMGDNSLAASINMGYDADLYKWNSVTIQAIKDGITLAQKSLKE